MSNKIKKDLKSLGLVAGKKKTDQMLKVGIISTILLIALYFIVGVYG
jgi:hypothetical protein